MNRMFKATFAAMLLTGAVVLGGAPAKADVAIGFSFGVDGGYFSDPCDYYDYYDQPPPWGLPPDYCEYPVYFEPIYVGGYWYRGPVYYRWYGGDRMYWINGRWRRDEWRGPRPQIRWTDRGGWHARGAWGNNGWGGRGDFHRDDRGGWDRGGDWDRGAQNRGGDWDRRNEFRDRDRGAWNRGSDWNQHNDFRGGDRRSWNGGDSGNWNRGGDGNQRNDFRGGDHQGWQGGNRGGGQGPAGGAPRGGEQGGRGGGHGGGDHHDRH